ncbi:hypothetical protein [Paremcibacter congregatus]|uniref:hypothetical protein n=1 Tax=Paremcibacter congregatus TaxID=2043170 RepID=UPI0030ED56A8|tara:strand:- start:4372 stop:4968 length:597 start_codon:yes stop_codon:yes gene_type:complete
MATKKKSKDKLEPVSIDYLGTEDENLGGCILRQVISIASYYFSDCEELALLKWQRAAISAYNAIKPQNELEAMLAAQMVGNHFTVMKCYQRAAIIEQPAEFKDMYLKHAAKLSRIYIEQVLALNKMRGKGQQKVTVEHIHIHSGGQAIVGNVNSDGGGAENKITEQPHTKQVTHAPEQAMPCQDPKGDKVPIPCHKER